MHPITFLPFLTGAYNLALQDQWTAAIYTNLVQVMNVFPIRVGGITISYDEDSVYVNAYVLTSSALGSTVFVSPKMYVYCWASDPPLQLSLCRLNPPCLL